MSISLRPALPKDAEVIAALEASCFADPWKVGDMASLLAEDTSLSFLFFEEERPIGYMTGRLTVDEGEVYRIAVLPDERRRGIGKTILSFAIDEGKKRGMNALFLEVRAQNTPAKSLYLSLGFSEIGTRKNYYKNPSDDAIAMRLDVK